MNEHASPLEADEENILKAALSTAFSPTHSPRNSIYQSRRRSNIPIIPSERVSSAVEPVPVESASEESTSQSSDDSWKTEYEAQVESWRAQSAEAREKAEKERARWEAIRAAEKAEADRQAAMGEVVEAHDGDHGWETVAAKSTSDPSSSQQSTYSLPESRTSTDARNLVLGELQGPHSVQASPQAKPDPSLSHSRHDTGDDHKLSGSQKWEDLHSSQTSSFPSLSFPDNPETPSPEPQATSKATPASTAVPFIATLAIFDSTLPTRTRVSALFSSLAINMLLPFVNGVMLGFGEIFAKNIVLGWFGWRVPGTIATGLGVGVRPIAEHRRKY